MREHLLSIEKRKGIKQEELEGPNPCPPELRHIFDYFIDLAATRDRSFGMSPLSYREIQAWSELTHTIIDPFEVRIIRDLDNVFMVCHRTASKEAGGEIPETKKSSKEVVDDSIGSKKRK